MRICVLNWRDLRHPLSGGAEVFVQEVLQRWAADGHDVVLVCAAVEGAPADEQVDGYRVVRRGGRLTVYREARRWWQEHGRGRFDAVVDCTNTVPFFAHEWVDDGARVLGLVFQTCEEIWNHNAPQPVALAGRYVLEPSWLRRYQDAPVLAISRSTQDSLARFGVHNVHVIPVGLDEPQVPDVPKNKHPTVVFCGRLVSYKRPDHVVRAVVAARRHVPHLQAWMIGGGPLLDRMRRQAPAGVTFLGRVSEQERNERMARAHVHVATSVREGWGLVVSEAAALGTPTLAYDVPGLRDSTLAAGGELVPAEPELLARRLVEVLARWMQDPPARIPRGGACSWDAVAQAWMAAIEMHARPSTGARTRR